jgi:Septum formation initiator
MRIIIALLVGSLILLQAKLWLGDGSVLEAWRLKQAVTAQRRQNERLLDRNRALAAEVEDLRKGKDAIEERARSELGMIRRDETFYHIVED